MAQVVGKSKPLSLCFRSGETVGWCNPLCLGVDFSGHFSIEASAALTILSKHNAVEAPGKVKNVPLSTPKEAARRHESIVAYELR